VKLLRVIVKIQLSPGVIRFWNQILNTFCYEEDNLLFEENRTVSQVYIIIPSSCQLAVENIIVEDKKMF